MAARLPSALTLAILFALPLAPKRSTAGVAPPDPSEVNEFDPKDGSSLFRMRFPKVYDGPLALCRTCGKALKDHVDPNFECRAPGSKARETDLRAVRCPVCGQGFEAPVHDPDPGGEIDRDFCRHAAGLSSRAAKLWMCPKCGYAAFHWGFGRPVDEQVRKFVTGTITPGTKEVLRGLAGLRPTDPDLKHLLEDFSFLKQGDIPEFLKYENALAVAKSRGGSDRALGRLHFEASHAYRRLLNGPVAARGLDRSILKVERMLVDEFARKQDPAALVSAGRRMLARADPDQATDQEKLTLRDRLFLSVRMAGLYDRLGEVWWVSKYLRDAGELASREPDERVRPVLEGLARESAGNLEREVHHQRRAVEHLRRALAGGAIAAPEESLLTVYLVGELLARTGEIAKAVPWLEATVSLAGVAADASGGRGQAPTLSRWATERLESAAFGEEADADEKRAVGEILARLGVGTPPAEAPARPAEPEAPGTVEAGEDKEPGPQPGSRPGPQPSIRPADASSQARPAGCREQLTTIWRALSAYRDARGEFPPDFKALVAAGLVTAEAAGDFVCAESGNRLFYRRPPPGSGDTFVVYHASPTTCTCPNMLYTDGTIRELRR